MKSKKKTVDNKYNYISCLQNTTLPRTIVHSVAPTLDLVCHFWDIVKDTIAIPLILSLDKKAEMFRVAASQDVYSCRDRFEFMLNDLFQRYKIKTDISTNTTILINDIHKMTAEMLDMLDSAFKLVGDAERPFGGYKVIGFGNLTQLNTFINEEEHRRLLRIYESEFFFSAQIFQSCKDMLFRSFEKNSANSITLGNINRKIFKG